MTQTTTLGTIVSHNTKTGKTTYEYKYNGKVLRTSVRKNYRYSTKDGSVFSSRLDLLYKNETYVRNYTWATDRANLTLEALIAETTDALKRATKEYAKYTSNERLQKQINSSIASLNAYGNPLTEERKEAIIKDWTESFARWASIDKEHMEEYTALLNDPDALNAELERLNNVGKAVLADLQVVEYVEA